MTLLNRELLSRVKLCVVSGLSHIVKDYAKMRNLPKIFLRSFENVAPGSLLKLLRHVWTSSDQMRVIITAVC